MGNGQFKKVNITANGDGNTIKEAIHNTSFSIPVSSIFTKDIKKLKTISNESIKITQNLYKILSTTKKNMSLL